MTTTTGLMGIPMRVSKGSITWVALWLAIYPSEYVVCESNVRSCFTVKIKTKKLRLSGTCMMMMNACVHYLHVSVCTLRR
ncbi:hypothetical protein K449DRAFT_258922 [Hypoxylon sp. EC38]|nr:hypothetical protein K449DRAFT_258922 [Hypoxylon sp. EC38]